MKTLFTCCIALFFFTAHQHAQVFTEESSPIEINSAIIIDNVVNTSGGIATGYTALGLFDFNVSYKPFNEGILKNTEFFGHVIKTGGGEPSGELIGDVQVASNIEGRSSRFVYQLLIKQRIGDFNLSFGLHDLNTEFMTSSYAGEYINSSFGIFPAVSLNIPVPIFPVTSLGGVVAYNKSNFDFVAGFYNLNHDYLEEASFDLSNHTFHKGYLGVAEMRYRIQNGEYKIGGYLKDCHPAPDAEGITPEHGKRKGNGFYVIADQQIYKTGNGISLGTFGQVGITPDQTNFAPEYYGLGVSAENFQKSYLPDFIGVAVGTVNLHEFDAMGELMANRNETVIELTAKKELWERFTIQPDIQYILSPSGVYNNALVGILRLQVELNK